MKKEDIRRYSDTELKEMLGDRKSFSDMEAVMAKSEEQLEADIASDPDWADIDPNWFETAKAMTMAEWLATASAAVPAPKKLMSLRLDGEVVDWFKSQGPGYQTRMNAVLLSFVQHQREVKKRA